MTPNGTARFGPAFENDLDLSDDATFSILEDLPRMTFTMNPDAPADSNVKSVLRDKIIATGRLDDSDLSSILDPPETSQPNRSIRTYRQRFMQGKEEEYAATLEAYAAMSDSTHANHVNNLEECRKFAQFAREKISGEVKVMGSSCHDRWCPMCAGQKASYAKEQTEMYINAMTEPRFLTLTLRNNPNDLKSQIEFLTMSFRTLRQRAYWKKNVTGGIWFLQVKRGKNSECWHPHLHIVIDGYYMEKQRLSQLWEQVTFGSPIIDIQRIHNAEETANYVARYTARPARLADMPLIDRVEVIASLQGKRMCGTFGTGKSVTLTPPKIESDSEWSTIGWYDEIMFKARTDPAAKKILRAYFNDEVLSEKDFESYTGHPINIVLEGYEVKTDPQLYLDFY